MIPFFYFNIGLLGLATLWCFTHLPGHGIHILASSPFFTSLLMLATVVGLIRRNPLALNPFLGFAGLLLCIPISFLTSGFSDSATSVGGGLMRHFLPAAVPAVVSGFADDLVFNLVISTIALITFRMIRSVKFSNLFEVEKASWPRTIACMAALLVLLMLNYTTAEKKAEAKGALGSLDSFSAIQSMMSSPDLQEAMATGDMATIAQKILEKQQSGTPAEKKALSDLQEKLGVKGLSSGLPAGDATADSEAARGASAPVHVAIQDCKFALDDSRLALVLSNQELVSVDLRTRQMTSRKVDSSAKILGSDLDYYFDLLAQAVRRFSDSKFSYALPPGVRFLSFTSTAGQILVYDIATGSLRRIESSTGRVISSVVMKIAQEPSAASTSSASSAASSAWSVAFTSLDLIWAYLRHETGKPFLFNIETGRIVEPDLSFTHIRAVEFGSTSGAGVAAGPGWVRISGQSDDGRMRLALVDLVNGRTEELPIPDGSISLFDRDRRTYLTSQAPVQLKNYSIASDGGVNVSTRDLGLNAPVLFTSILNGGRFVAVGEDSQKQMMVIDLDRGELSRIGTIHETALARGSTCFAVSATRQLFLVATAESVQVFWTSELGAPAPRSLTIPLRK